MTDGQPVVASLLDAVENCLLDETAFIAIIDHLYGIRLYAYYVVYIERYKPVEIDGMLMTQPFEFYGPFSTRADAQEMVNLLVDNAS
jgi:hypothetical protein